MSDLENPRINISSMTIVNDFLSSGNCCRGKSFLFASASYIAPLDTGI